MSAAAFGSGVRDQGASGHFLRLRQAHHLEKGGRDVGESSILPKFSIFELLIKYN